MHEAEQMHHNPRDGGAKPHMGDGRSALASDQMTGITLTTPLALWPKPHTMIHPHSPPISLLHHSRTHFRDSSAH